jgi:hypothetical protein
VNVHDLIWKYAIDVGVDVLLSYFVDGSFSAIVLFYGGKVKGNEEFESLNEQLQFFSTPHSFDALLTQCREKFGWSISLKGSI